MKTLVLTPALYAHNGGIERLMRLYTHSLVEITAPESPVAIAALLDTDPAPLRRLGASRVLVGRGRRPAFAARVFFEGRRADRILCGHLHLAPLAWAAATTSPKTRFWLVAHGIEVWPALRGLRRRALRAAERVLCVSDYTRNKLLANDGALDPSRFIVLPNATEPHLLEDPRRFDDPPRPPVILTVSRLSKSDDYKGIDSLIEALPSVRARIPGATLRIVGDGDDAPRLRALADQVNESGAVVFTGKISDDALRDELAACRIFALPSTGEGFGIACIEAMAFGKPCVVADATALPEVVPSGCGLRVPPRNLPALASTLADALTQNWDHHAIRAHAARFSPDAFRQRLHEAWSKEPGA